MMRKIAIALLCAGGLFTTNAFSITNHVFYAANASWRYNEYSTIDTRVRIMAKTRLFLYTSFTYS